MVLPRFRHTPPDGSIPITARRLANNTRIEARDDDGCGIAPEHLPRVLDRVYRTVKARSRAQGGAGRGLSIARWIVEHHHGAIELNSQPGIGTTVWIPLPAARQS